MCKIIIIIYKREKKYMLNVIKILYNYLYDLQF